MKQCPNCGRKYFDDETSYCMNCKYRLEHIEGTTEDKRSELPVNDTPENRQKVIGNQPPQVECTYCKSINTKNLVCYLGQCQ